MSICATPAYLHSDHLGSTPLATDNTGIELGPAEFDAYGQIVSFDPELAALTDPAALATGQRFDPNIGLYECTTSRSKAEGLSLGSMTFTNDFDL